MKRRKKYKKTGLAKTYLGAKCVKIVAIIVIIAIVISGVAIGTKAF